MIKKRGQGGRLKLPDDFPLDGEGVLGDRLKSWWAGPISWKWMLLVALALLSMIIFPLVTVIYKSLVDK